MQLDKGDFELKEHTLINTLISNGVLEFAFPDNTIDKVMFARSPTASFELTVVGSEDCPGSKDVKP